MPRLRSTRAVVVAILALAGSLAMPAALQAANSDSAPAAVATPAAAAAAALDVSVTPGAATAPAAAPRLKRLIEPRSGTEFRLDARWQAVSADSTAGLDFLLDGDANKGSLRLRFPIHYPDPPADATSAYDLDLQLEQEHPDTVPKGLKNIDNPGPPAAVGEGLQLLLHSARFDRGKRRYVLRRYYLTTAESKVIAITCTLPESTLGAADACQTFVRSSALMDSRDRADRLSLLQKQEQRDPNADRYTISCGTINQEVSAWRNANTTARLEQMPRFATLYSELLVKAYVGGNNRAIAEASQSASAYIARIAATCSARPEVTYGDAAESAK